MDERGVAVMARGTAAEKGGLRYRDGIGDDIVRGPEGPVEYRDAVFSQGSGRKGLGLQVSGARCKTTRGADYMSI